MVVVVVAVRMLVLSVAVAVMVCACLVCVAIRVELWVGRARRGQTINHINTPSSPWWEWCGTSSSACAPLVMVPAWCCLGSIEVRGEWEC